MEAYIAGRTAEAENAAALVEEKDKEIERLKEVMKKAYIKLSSLLRKTAEYHTNSLLDEIENLVTLGYLEQKS